MNNHDQLNEQYITDCGKAMLAAHGRGDVQAARDWLRLQNEAIKARSGAQVQHMEACYFLTQGDLARERMAG